MKFRKAITYAAVVGLMALAIAEPSFAQDAWEEPAIGLVERLESGLVKIAAALIGIGIIVYGAYGTISGRLDWLKFGMILFGGILVMAGPGMIRALLSMA
ncbi:TrbC/VirB2 family protein [Telmatospirillum sp. J64-1]|uniref:TrbC/VirB2 family protein n=1 Tax=Telmatospirillum sp. J64-1 TaxID=2502183 RepID=UPI00115CB77D|nr:TrbC/VirB2 family protein [Telmatospirillum sp. J64-1]